MIALEAALGYAARGWRVFPIFEATAGACACRDSGCKRPGKHPRISEGLHGATTDEQRIRSWWDRWPDASIGIATGKASNLTVIDADAGNGKPGVINLTKLAAKHGGLPPTIHVKTGGGGAHYYFQFCEALRTGANVLADAVDVRSEGGYVIAPPSVHVSGERYELVKETSELPAVPDWMLVRKPLRERVKRPQSLTIEQAVEALQCIDPDERDTWLNVGVILGREYNRSPEAWAAYEAWAARSPKFDEDRAGNLARMRERFHEASQESPRAGGKPLSIGTFIDLARKGGWEAPAAELRDGDHYQLAQAVVASIERETGERPVFAHGALWSAEDDVWCARSLDNVAMDVARRFAGGKYCRRGSDFASIAHVVAKICENERFFEQAAVGIAAPGGFWRVTPAGEIEHEPLTPNHRQRMRVAADPDLRAEPRRLLKVLTDAFAENEPEGQTRLVQQLFGCAITRSLWRHRVVALFLGATNSGKSTLLTLLSSVFPRDQLGACGPQKWGNEYYVAALAGVALNVVGDLDKKEPIPGYFKNVVGRDLIQGRHPTHRPFTFVCEASHFFNSNHTPPTADHSDAFFNRWRVIHFAKSVPASARDRDLDKRLIAEETGAMLGWALRGAADVAKSGAICESETHNKVLQRWRVANNSALAFIFDTVECELSADASTPGQDLYRAYREWANDNGMRPFGRNGFYEALTEGAGDVPIQVIPRESSADHQVHVRGVRCKGGGF